MINLLKTQTKPRVSIAATEIGVFRCHFLRIHKNYKFIISFLKERIKNCIKKLEVTKIGLIFASDFRGRVMVARNPAVENKRE